MQQAAVALKLKGSSCRTVANESIALFQFLKPTPTRTIHRLSSAKCGVSSQAADTGVGMPNLCYKDRPCVVGDVTGLEK